MSKEKTTQHQTQQQSPPPRFDSNRDNQSSGSGAGEERLSPKEYHQKRLNEDVAKLQAGGYAIIQKKTNDTAETRNFINLIDTLMYQARMSAGPKGSRVTFDDLDKKFMPRIQSTKEQLNILCAELCHLLGKPYRPPRGFNNPLKNGKPAQQQQPAEPEKTEKTEKPTKATPPAKPKAEKPEKTTAETAEA